MKPNAAVKSIHETHARMLDYVQKVNLQNAGLTIASAYSLYFLSLRLRNREMKSFWNILSTETQSKTAQWRTE